MHPIPSSKIISFLSFLRNRGQKGDQSWLQSQAWAEDGGLSGCSPASSSGEGDDVWVVVVDEAWESTGLSTAHADLAVLPLA